MPSGKKPDVSKERVPSDKKAEQLAEKATPEPAAPTEKVPLDKEPEVTKAKTPTEDKPEVTIEKRSVEENDEVSKERAPSLIKRERTPSAEKIVGTKPPIMGVKPFALPRDRTGTAPSAQSRVGGSTPEKDASKPASEEPAAKLRGPPKFGIGIGGVAGGGLLAEMKQRQERAASLGRVRTTEVIDLYNNVVMMTKNIPLMITVDKLALLFRTQLYFEKRSAFNEILYFFYELGTKKISQFPITPFKDSNFEPPSCF